MMTNCLGGVDVMNCALNRAIIFGITDDQNGSQKHRVIWMTNLMHFAIGEPNLEWYERSRSNELLKLLSIHRFNP